ncbi:hypothetical protein GCM10007242_30170 [Pigmentiphaga litoralis]|nr:hypothetical protein GCM10007242_30170 [Pigmentiphaga litoralis]
MDEEPGTLTAGAAAEAVRAATSDTPGASTSAAASAAPWRANVRRAKEKDAFLKIAVMGMKAPVDPAPPVSEMLIVPDAARRRLPF